MPVCKKDREEDYGGLKFPLEQITFYNCALKPGVIVRITSDAYSTTVLSSIIFGYRRGEDYTIDFNDRMNTSLIPEDRVVRLRDLVDCVELYDYVDSCVDQTLVSEGKIVINWGVQEHMHEDKSGDFRAPSGNFAIYFEYKGFSTNVYEKKEKLIPYFEITNP